MPVPKSVLPFPVPSGSPDLPLRSLVRALWSATDRARPDLLGGLLAASAGLADVLDWAAQGAGADETAAVWLQNFRWARAAGIPLPEAAPVPPRERWEERLAALGTGTVPERLAEALAAEQMQYPARHDFPDLDDDAFFPRLVPLAVYPQDSVPHLGQLSVNLTALTHGSGEALATGLVWALLLRAVLAPRAGAEPVPTDSGSALRTALGTVRSLLLDDTDSGDRVPAGGLRAAMAATGSSRGALHRVLDRAPGTRAWLAGDAAWTERAPGCLRSLADAVAGAEDASAPGWAAVLRAGLDWAVRDTSSAGTSTGPDGRPRPDEGAQSESDPDLGLAEDAALRWSRAVERWAGF